MILIIFSFFIEPPLKNIGEISIKNMDEWIKVRGEITNIKETGGVTILNLKDETGEIMAVVFDKLDIKKEKVEIIGKVENYKGTLEIVIKRIKPLKD